jgi:hypothetical protein
MCEFEHAHGTQFLSPTPQIKANFHQVKINIYSPLALLLSSANAWQLFDLDLSLLSRAGTAIEIPK